MAELEGNNFWMITYTGPTGTRIGKTLKRKLVEDLYTYGSELPCSIEGRRTSGGPSLDLHIRMRGTDGEWRHNLETTSGLFEIMQAFYLRRNMEARLREVFGI